VTGIHYDPFDSCVPDAHFARYRSTGKVRDAESGNDYFGARYYASNMGRMMSPDPSGIASVDPTNPQSWNMYSYALNNPLLLIDPTGLDPCPPNGGGGTSVASSGGGGDRGSSDDGGVSVVPKTAWVPHFSKSLMWGMCSRVRTLQLTRVRGAQFPTGSGSFLERGRPGRPP
jgi:RHS repeat-associated protein